MVMTEDLAFRQTPYFLQRRVQGLGVFATHQALSLRCRLRSSVLVVIGVRSAVPDGSTGGLR
jgi:hypothetical protein